MTATRISGSRLVRGDASDGLSGNDRVADLEQQRLDYPADRRRDLGIHLVGVHLHQRFALVDVLALLLAPGADRDLFRALQLGHDYLARLDAHGPIVGQAIDTTSSRSSSQ